MNREIKFRAWSKKDEAMLNWNVITQTAFNRDGLGILYSLLVVCRNDDDTVLMQFTGLYDKNGNEIYEGDIVKAIHYNFSHPDTIKTQLVYFENGCFCIKSIGEEVINLLQEDRNNVPIFWLQAPSSMEVIGNIHQNPELL